MYIYVNYKCVGKKPVFWSPSTRTALAESELEYEDNHTSQSVYVAFPLLPLKNDSPLLSTCLNKYNGNLSMLIWTTTPWTLPSNVAISISSKVEYDIVSFQEGLICSKKTIINPLFINLLIADNCYYVIASKCVEKVEKVFNR